uniref:Uncharacterized protein n=1 Tax=Panagrolaimus sp. ES5 TaxID=591445 RepID=A0AC34GL38_9BILA
MTNAAASPPSQQHPFATTRLTIPSNHHHQVDIALRTYPCSNTGSDYGYIPSQIHPPPSSTATYQLQGHHGHGQAANSCGYHTLPYNRNHQHQNFQATYNPNLHIIPTSSTNDILPAPNNLVDLNMAFYAPPPSAASLSTYGVVKPAFMPQNITP